LVEELLETLNTDTFNMWRFAVTKGDVDEDTSAVFAISIAASDLVLNN
jgi:hypothetical protein